jgi:hypothetical protein
MHHALRGQIIVVLTKKGNDGNDGHDISPLLEKPHFPKPPKYHAYHAYHPAHPAIGDSDSTRPEVRISWHEQEIIGDLDDRCG